MKRIYQEIEMKIFVFDAQDIVTFSSIFGDGTVEDSVTHKDVYTSENRWW